jgi:hypothetical protein
MGPLEQEQLLRATFVDLRNGGAGTGEVPPSASMSPASAREYTLPISPGDRVR